MHNELVGDVHTLLERGPEAVLAAVADDDGTLNTDVLAQTCARRTGASETAEEATAWAGAAVACYEEVAKHREPGFDRQGSEVIMFGVMAALILRWGASDDAVRDLAAVERWLAALTVGHEGPDDFRRALTGGAKVGRAERENALLLKERLSAIGVPLLDAGLISVDLRPWLVAAGLVAAKPEPARSEGGGSG